MLAIMLLQRDQRLKMLFQVCKIYHILTPNHDYLASFFEDSAHAIGQIEPCRTLKRPSDDRYHQDPHCFNIHVSGGDGGRV